MTAPPTMGLEALVEAATRAPSSHNTQPWLFRCKGQTLELYADRTRALPVNDPWDRELTISCGAALFNLRTAAEAAGRPAAVRLLPDGPDDDLLAVLDVGAGHHRGWRRSPTRSGRGEPTAAGSSPDRCSKGCATASTSWRPCTGCRLRWVPTGAERDRVAELVGGGDRAQFDDPSWRRELAVWMHPRRTGDGLAVPLLAGPAIRFAVSRLDMGARTGDKDAASTRDAPAVALLATTGDAPADWLTAGQALQHLLLVAAADGVQAGYANQPLQVVQLRPRLADALTLTTHPQLLLRLGTPEKPPTPSPRRPLHEVIAAFDAPLPR